jgi:O-methyltransferase/8-demethyl-8-(2,3-dimethoxy-alpha-L-rhamnosyl)tetracenomycin-C 4'-O-methyltransferase
MVGTQRIRNVAELTQRVLDDKIPGDFIEAGVWRGGCCIQMKGVLAANGVTDRKIYLADSFEGLPAPNVGDYPSDDGYDLTGFSQLAVSVEGVRENFRRYGLLDDQIVFVKGWFSDTLPNLNAGPFALIRLDGDMYESTYISLETLYPKLSPGGFVIIDDVNFLPPCKQAVFDYRAKMGIKTPLIAVDWCASWWRKE